MTAAEDRSSLVLLDVQDGVGLITFNRPQRHNGWTHDFGQAYFDRFDEADAHPDVRAIVVTGAGRSFCPGLDKGVLADASGTAIAVHPGTRPLTHPLAMSKPTVAAVNGGCAGIGFVQAALCDIRFAARRARFSTSFARRGVAAEHAISYLLPRQVGLQRALDLLVSGRTFGAEEAHQYGFVLEVHDDDAVLDAAVAYARELATWSSPTAMAVIRRQVYDDLDHHLEASRVRSVELMEQLSAGSDFEEGVASYLEGRPPSFGPLRR